MLSMGGAVMYLEGGRHQFAQIDNPRRVCIVSTDAVQPLKTLEHFELVWLPPPRKWGHARRRHHNDTTDRSGGTGGLSITRGIGITRGTTRGVGSHGVKGMVEGL
jgi:hypothetical protein